MNTVDEVMDALREKGDPARVKLYARHNAPTEKLFGVSIADLKKIAKQIKGKQELAYQLYDTGNGDARYLAGIVANGALMPQKLIDSWAKASNWQMISEYTVPWVATESEFAQRLASKWI